MYSYTDQWVYSGDVIKIEHFNQALKHNGTYTIKRHTEVDRNMYFNGTAFLPTIWCKQRLFYFFLSQNLRFIWGAMEETGLSTLLDLTLISQSDTMALQNEYLELFSALGFKKVLKLQDNSTKNFCFKRLVVGQRLAENFNTLQERLTNKFKVGFSQCLRPRICVVQRKRKGHFRRVLNIEAIRTYLQPRLPHDDVIELDLDDKGFTEQLRDVTCCRVFIGVQGAALAWSAFLPRDALLVEISNEYWTPRFVTRAKIWRPDLRTAVVKCDIRTSDASFLSYARRTKMKEFGVDTKTVTKELKQKVYENSHKALKTSYYPFGLPLSIWKLSDVYCDPTFFDFID